MKKLLKAILGIVGFVYLLFIIFVTVCLLGFNEYKVTEIKDKTFILIDDKSDKYNDGDLVIFTRNGNDDINGDDEISFYEVTRGKSSVNIGKVTDKEKITDDETTFVINGSHKISSESVIGKTETAKVIPKLGKVLYVFESQYGFLLLVIFPSLMLFFYAAYSFIKELKNSNEDDEDDEDDEENIESSETETEETKNSANDDTLPLKKDEVNTFKKVMPREKKDSPIALKRPSENDKKNDL